MGKFLLFVIAVVTLAFSKTAGATDDLFAIQGKIIGVNATGQVICTYGCSENNEPVVFDGDKVDFTFNVWYVAGPTVFGRTDGGVSCPSGYWYAIDTYTHHVQELKLPTCDAVETKMVATGDSIEFDLLQKSKTSRYIFTDK